MQRNFYSFILLGLVLILTNSCAKKSDNSTPAPVTPTQTVQVPVLTTTALNSNITTSTTNYGGSITSDGGANITARGVCWSTTTNPTTANSKTTDGAGAGSFTSTITGLTASTTYHVRAYAINSAGTGYGNDVSFTTLPQVPILTTAAISNITSSTASCGGTITSDGGVAITVRGVSWSTSATTSVNGGKTTDGTGTGTFASSITGLLPNTTYYVQAYATTSAGTGVGTIISFTTLPQPTVTDIDGNIYHTVTIGTQVWMVENLKTTKYRNGDPVANASDPTAWGSATTGAYCNYNNDASNVATYGRLYNSYVLSDTRNIAPVGWHVPTSAEWTTLTSYISPVGGDMTSGGDLKETGTTHWQSPNYGATNAYFFTALPGGYRSYNGGFSNIGLFGYWWTSSPFDANNTYYRIIDYIDNDVVKGGYARAGGMSIRCVKD